MRKVALLACLTLISLPSIAETATVPSTEAAPVTTTETVAVTKTAPARLDCDALKARVDAKLQAKGVPVYTLEIVPAEGSTTAVAASGVPAVKMNKGKEVGTCDGGTKRLMYTRGN
jgi:hypothetical protein